MTLNGGAVATEPDVIAEYRDLLVRATATLSPEYFELPIHDGDPTYRERVYCYELYYHIRALWPEGSPYRLGGEVDKRNHPHFRYDSELRNSIPDLVVHVPGNMDGNLIVIEVKPANARTERIVDDLRKLTAFCARAQYQRGILLLYGHVGDGIHDTLGRVLSEATGDRRIDLSTIDIFHHKSPGDGAIPIHIGKKDSPPFNPLVQRTRKSARR